MPQNSKQHTAGPQLPGARLQAYQYFRSQPPSSSSSTKRPGARGKRRQPPNIPRYRRGRSKRRGSPMGAWGHASDENDQTYDQLGWGVEQRIAGVSLTEEAKKALPTQLARERPECLQQAGVVVLLIKLGCTLPTTVIETALDQLALDARWFAQRQRQTSNRRDGDEGESKSERFDREVRSVITHEILLLKACVAAGGQLPASPIGVQGMLDGGTRPLARGRSPFSASSFSAAAACTGHSTLSSSGDESTLRADTQAQMTATTSKSDVFISGHRPSLLSAAQTRVLEAAGRAGGVAQEWLDQHTDGRGDAARILASPSAGGGGATADEDASYPLISAQTTEVTAVGGGDDPEDTTKIFCWGLGSDENSDTYEALGLGVTERVMGVCLTDAGKLSLPSQLARGVRGGMSRLALAQPGVVVLLVKLGCCHTALTPAVIGRAIAQLQADAEHNISGHSAERFPERCDVVRQEIAMLQVCLQAGGMLPADQAVVPMGVKGILSGGTRSLRQQQQQQ